MAECQNYGLNIYIYIYYVNSLLNIIIFQPLLLCLTAKSVRFGKRVGVKGVNEFFVFLGGTKY